MKVPLLQALSASSLPSHLARDLASSPPTVTLDNATVTGINQGSLTKFLGIPFAQPPVGNLRFRAPQAVASYNGSINGTAYSAICMQQTAPFPISLSDILNITSLPASLQGIVKNIIVTTLNSSDPETPPQSEDCLNINIIKPANVSADAKLPVLVWIYGGGFERGSAFEYDDLGTRVVNRSIELGQPVIYAAMDYRVSAWGFLASQEVQNAGEGNMGLQDQRLALQWVQQHIGLFGGDPSKVTIWGQSAGSISASLQMLAYGGNSTDLFRGAFMQSGAPIPIGNMTGGQSYYNALVSQTDCASSNDTLSCLRNVPGDQLAAAVDKSPNYFNYTSLALAWSPRADGIFLQDNPQRLVEQGKVMNIPIVSGNVDDEGTLFSMSSLNVTTDAKFRQYIRTVWVPGANESTLDPLWSYYPSDEQDGSPFNTADFNAITPQYKRIAAFQGDVVFQAPRRFFLQYVSGRQKVWSYLSRRLKLTPAIGSFHSSDLELGILDDYIVRFTYNLDPNNGTEPTWPEYTNDSPQLYTFPYDTTDSTITNDTYREEPMRYLMNLSLAHPL